VTTLLDAKSDCKKVIKKFLQERASALLLQRVLDRIESVEDEAQLKKSIADVGVAVRMFVDEELGKEITAELTKAAKL
jgi:hypothetical protein